MTERRIATLAVAAALTIAAAACQHRVQPEMHVSTAPVLPPAVTAPDTRPGRAATRSDVGESAAEQRVTIDTYGRDLDVRKVLDFLANQGHFSLVYSPEIDRRIRLQLNDVPLSVALQTVLTMAGLTLESTTEPPRAPASTSIVFYQLPVNVDSLSVEAIMKRFGVGRGIAELIVQSRVERP